MNQILLVEDDDAIVMYLKHLLEREGFKVSHAPGQKDALALAAGQAFDLVLMDVSLKDGNGFSACKNLQEQQKVPVMFLTASDDEYSVVTGLDLGADDYISKPFRPRELISRIKSVLRRNGLDTRHAPILAEDIEIDLDKGKVTRNGSEIVLSALEYRLLLVFANNRGVTFSRNRLLQEIWDLSGEYVNDNTLTVYIKRLRDKIETEPQNPSIIRTIRGIGYRME